MDLLEKYADILVNIGVHLNEGQMLVVNSSVECAPLTRLIVKKAYEAKASYVMVRWSDDIVNHEYYLHAADEAIDEIPDWIVDQFHFIVDKVAAVISIASPSPGLMQDVNPKRLQRASKASEKKLSFYHDVMMASKVQWCVAAYPSYRWAKKVFPELEEKEAYNKLFKAILDASRVKEDNDPVRDWMLHMENLEKHTKKLNDLNFKFLHFKNSLGTDLTVELVKNHIWGGGGEFAANGTYFAPNIPTEEVFTMPHSHGVNGVVYSSKPLNYQGKLIEDFRLEFKDGKVIDYSARTEQSALETLLTVDEGSSRLGEVALISYDSPISNSGIIFYNTLFDENASCHLALGNAYPTCIKDGTNLPLEELLEKGYNKSMVHVDFMFGTSDMQVIGEKENGEKVVVFKDGNFAL